MCKTQNFSLMLIFEIRKLYMALLTKNNKGTYVRNFLLYKNDS